VRDHRGLHHYAGLHCEDDHGWWVKGAFDLGSPKGTQVYRLVKGGLIRELSFAFDIADSAQIELEDGTKARELRDVEVYEFSFVPVGANRDTSVVAVKAQPPGPAHALTRVDLTLARVEAAERSLTSLLA